MGARFTNINFVSFGVPPINNTFTFQTDFNVPTDGTFSPALTTINGEIPTWTLIEGYQQTTAAFNKSDRTSLGSTELDGTCQDVVVTFSTNDPSNITELLFSFKNLCNTLDLSVLPNISDYQFNGNPDLNYVINPTSSTLVTNYNCNASDLLDLDISTINLGGDFVINNNFNLATLTTGSNSNVFTTFNVGRTALTTLDMSGYTGLGGDIRFNNISVLTTVLNPISSQLITGYIGQLSNISTIDITTLTNFSNSGLVFELRNNNLSVATVNASLVHLDSVLTTGTGTITFQNNSAVPTGTGATAKANLITKGYTVTTD